MYIHIPFCKHLCSYCDFPKRINPTKDLIEKYLESLKMELMSKNLPSLDTIYIGGGTPNMLSLLELELLLNTIHQFTNGVKEFTIELNPEFITHKQLSLLKKYGINRLSIGIQSFSSRLLSTIGRFNDVDVIIRNVELAHQFFDNISIDMIFGIPTMSLKELRTDLKTAMQLKPAHISYYSLILEEKTVLHKQINDKLYSLVGEDLEGDMYELVIATLRANKYQHYEISNFATMGFESFHNKLYWNRENYYQAGLAASGYIDNIVYENTDSLTKYISGNYLEGITHLELNDLKENYFLMGLRLLSGVSLTKYQELFNVDPYNDFPISELIKGELLIVKNDHLMLTHQGLFLGNYVFSKFIGGWNETDI